ncbi:MAG: peptidase MA family metallohydrolase [Thermomicrobiales bacterium]
MGSSLHHRPSPPVVRRALLFSVLSLLLLALAPIMPAAAAPPSGQAGQAGPPPDWPVVETEHFRFYVQPNEELSADAFVATYQDQAERALSELSVVFAVQPTDKIAVYVYADTAAFDAAVAALDAAVDTTGRVEVPGVEAVADPRANDIAIAAARFGTRTPLEAENALRHAVSHILTGIASNFAIPRGFDEGIALYMERPVNARIARYAADVLGTSQGGGLLSWSDLNRPRPVIDDENLIAGEAYAVVAFLISRYRLPSLQTFLTTLRTAPDWREALELTYGREPEDIEKQWRENIPRWAAGEWKVNLVAGFDLAPARDLLTRGNYAAAKQALEGSQQLFSELGDDERLTEVDELLTQCDTGLQAEQLMTQVQQALDHHTYDRAASLLVQAAAQYEKLPVDQRPTELIATYETLAVDGVEAGTRLDEAIARSHRWGDYPEARSAALQAGTTYARLGDEEMTAQARSLLADLDGRQRRIVMMLGALAALTIAWLGLWLWARGRSELAWD